MFTLTAIASEKLNSHFGTNPKHFWREWFEERSDFGKNKSSPGSKVYILKQDASVDMVGVRMKWIREDIKSGPRTDMVTIKGLLKTVYPSDSENNFLYHPNQYGEEFDALNCLSIVTSVLRMYRKCLKELLPVTDFTWQWGSGPLEVYPRAGEEENAAYIRKHRALKFYYFKSSSRKTVYSARSFDIVAHETGHAILDALRPDWNHSHNPYTNALHESIGDLSAIFAILDDLDLCDSVVTHSKGNLHQHTFFSTVGEEFGLALGMRFGLRNVNEDKKLDSVSSQMHELSTVFTSAIYDILADIFHEELKKNDFEEPAIVLHRVGAALFRVFLKALTRSPQEDATFYDIAQLMLDNEKETSNWLVMKKYFNERQILDLQISKLHNEQTFRETLRSHLAESKELCGYHKTCFADMPQ